jgi:hypothetical protein
MAANLASRPSICNVPHSFFGHRVRQNTGTLNGDDRVFFNTGANQAPLVEACQPVERRFVEPPLDDFLTSSYYDRVNALGLGLALG